MSAALVMLTGEYMYEAFGTGDPARLGAQVVSGIGFLGAGSIIIEGNTKIRGLTTAAGLWSGDWDRVLCRRHPGDGGGVYRRNQVPRHFRSLYAQ